VGLGPDQRPVFVVVFPHASSLAVQVLSNVAQLSAVVVSLPQPYLFAVLEPADLEWLAVLAVPLPRSIELTT
jgi:hypothetical protein